MLRVIHSAELVKTIDMLEVGYDHPGSRIFTLSGQMIVCGVCVWRFYF